MMRFDEQEQMQPRRGKPNQEALIGALGGGQTAGLDQLAPDAATAQRNRAAMPDGPLKQMIGAMGPVGGGFAPGEQVGAPQSSIFQSGNRSVGGYLQEAAAAKRGDIIGIADEAGRKRAAEEYIRSLIPEIQARGGQVGDIRNEKIQIDGRWKDLYQDIEGAANAQYIEPDEGGAAPMGGGGMAMNPAGLMGMMQQDPTSAIQSQLAQYMQRSPNLQALLAQLGGQAGGQ